MWFQSNWPYFWPSKKIITKDLESSNSNILEIRMSWTKVKKGQFSKPTHSFCRRNNGMVPSMVWLTFLTWFTTNSLLLAVCSLWLGSGYKKDRSLSEPGGATPDFDRSVSPISTRGKFFTYVTKTRAHLSTYSRKPWNYNDTIIIEIDIMKNLSSINLNLGQTWLFYKFFGCFFCFDLLCHT